MQIYPINLFNLICFQQELLFFKTTKLIEQMIANCFNHKKQLNWKANEFDIESQFQT